jgi:hypothetical protein
VNAADERAAEGCARTEQNQEGGDEPASAHGLTATFHRAQFTLTDGVKRTPPSILHAPRGQLSHPQTAGRRIEVRLFVDARHARIADETTSVLDSRLILESQCDTNKCWVSLSTCCSRRAPA